MLSTSFYQHLSINIFLSTSFYQHLSINILLSTSCYQHPAINILRFHSLGSTLHLEVSNLAFSGRPENPLFRFFEASGLPESLFSGILRLRDSPTVHFHKKQLVGASRNIVFLNFYLSGCPEARFFPFLARRLQAKRCF